MRIILEAWNGVAQNDGNMLKKPCLKHNSLYGKKHGMKTDETWWLEDKE